MVLSDSGDNPTGGGTGDRADALAELLRKKVTSAVVAGIADRPATLACYKAGVGATIPLKIGATLDPATEQAHRRHGQGGVPGEDRQTCPSGRRSWTSTASRSCSRRDAGRSTCPTDFTSLGLEPTSFKIVVVKAGYLVPEIAAFANPNLMALTDGAVNQDIPRLSNQHRVPTFPFVQDLTFTPVSKASARAGRN